MTRDAAAAAAMAALLAPVQWALPVVAHAGGALVTGGLGLALLTAAAAAPLLLLVGADRRTPRAALALALGGLGTSLEVWGLATWVHLGAHGAGVWLPALVLPVLPWALLVAGVRAAHGRWPAAPGVALVLVLVVPATTAAIARGTAQHPLTVTAMVAAWRHPDLQQLTQLLVHSEAGDTEALFAAGDATYRDKACLGYPTASPPLPGVPLGVPQRTRVACSALARRCTLTRTDAYATPPLPGSDARLLDWTVQTDLQGRFSGVDVGTAARPGFFRPLRPWPDAMPWLLNGLGTLGTGGVLWLVLFALLRTPRPATIR